jgi:hypothetical protein
MDERARRAAPIVELVVGIVATLCVVVAWLQSAPELARDDAAATMTDALASVGIQDPRVSGVQPCRRAVTGPAERPTFGPAVCNDDAELSDGRVVKTWEGAVQVGQSTIVVSLDRSTGRVAYIDDVVGGSTRLLTDEQFGDLDDFDGAGVQDDHRTRNIVLTLAAVLVAVTAEQLRRRLAKLAPSTPTPHAPGLELTL